MKKRIKLRRYKYLVTGYNKEDDITILNLPVKFVEPVTENNYADMSYSVSDIYTLIDIVNSSNSGKTIDFYTYYDDDFIVKPKNIEKLNITLLV